MRAYCLADLFNLELWPSGRPPNYADIRDGLGQLADRVLTAVPHASEVTTRLYGGWDGNIPAAQSDLRPMVARSIDDMPRRRGRQIFRIELAESPVWDRTVPIRNSVRMSRATRLRTTVELSRDCLLGPAQCTLASFESWCKGRCPATGCPVRLSDVASRHTQKMVDTLLTADAMAIRYEKLADTVVLASDDHDMVPALLALVASEVELVYLTKRDARGFYRDLLEREGARVCAW